jgi:biotin operon repressor
MCQVIEHHIDPRRHGGGERGQTPHRHRFFVRLPIAAPIGYARSSSDTNRSVSFILETITGLADSFISVLDKWQNGITLGTSARLLRLLSLFQARRCWVGAELADRLEITGRTLRRDVDRLRRLGYPVHSTAGTAGGYQLGAGATLPPLLLEDGEAVAVGLRTAADGTVAGIEEASVRALSKLEQVLPPRLRRRVAALSSFIMPLANAGRSGGGCGDAAGERQRVDSVGINRREVVNERVRQRKE